MHLPTGMTGACSKNLSNLSTRTQPLNYLTFYRSRRIRHDHHILSTDSSGISTSTSTKLSNLQQQTHSRGQQRQTSTTDYGGVSPTGGVGGNNHLVSSNSKSAPRCPHHIPLPDGEWGDDRHLQIRTQSQVGEILVESHPLLGILRVQQNTYNSTFLPIQFMAFASFLTILIHG